MSISIEEAVQILQNCKSNPNPERDYDPMRGGFRWTDEIPPVRGTQWLDYAASFPIAFAQVREDPLVDKWIVEQLPDSSQGVMIASGGCTAAVLAASEKFEHLALVDVNLAQLELSRFKLAMVSDYGPEHRLGILGHHENGRSMREMPNLSRDDLLRHDICEECFGPFEEVSAVGLDFSGRYELLFSRLQFRISEIAKTKYLLELNSIEEQNDFLDANPKYIEDLESAFSEVMALPNLVRLFGNEATQNSILPFAEHFLTRTLQAIKSFPASSNPYLAQLLSGSFPQNSIYPWFELPQQPIGTHVAYEQCTMDKKLRQGSEKFDFIHLSNILDWLSIDEAKALLGLASFRLKVGGWLVIRQLNSSLAIPELCNSLDWQPEIAASLHAADRSFFYKKLHVARKP